MEHADKILVLITPDYLTALQQTFPSSGEGGDEGNSPVVTDGTFPVESDGKSPKVSDVTTLKVHTELHHLKSILYNNLYDFESVVVVTKGVSGELPSVFARTPRFKFPKSLDPMKDGNFSTIVDVLLDKKTFSGSSLS